MRTSPNRAKPKARRRRRFTSNELLVVIGVLAVVASLAVIFFKQQRDNDEKINITKCKSNLKSIGLELQSYYSDGKSTVFGSATANNRIDEKIGGFGFTINGHECAAKKTHGKEDGYVFDRNTGAIELFKFPTGKENPFTILDTWQVVDNPNSPIAHDKDSTNAYNNKTNVLCGDGHVEQK